MSLERAQERRRTMSTTNEAVVGNLQQLLGKLEANKADLPQVEISMTKLGTVMGRAPLFLAAGSFPTPPPIDPEVGGILTASQSIHTASCRCLPGDAVPIPRGSVSLPREPVSILWPADAYRETRYRYRGARYPYRESRYAYFGPPMLTERPGIDTVGLGILTLARRCLGPVTK